MSDYSQVTFFGPKDALPSGNPSKLIKGTEIDPELSAISTAVASKYDSADVADNTQADAAVSDAVLMTPLKVKRLLENATFDLASGVTKDGAGLVLSTRSVVSGAGLTGGATLAGDVTLAVGAGTGITVNADDVALDTAHVRNVDHSAVSISAGGALTGGGTIAASRTITLDVNGLVEETSVAGSTDFVLLYDTSSGTHKKAKPDNISSAFGGFVPNARQVISGAGLTGGGDLSGDRTLAVGAGTGITVNADDVALNTAHSRNADHDAISISAGSGLTGGGLINANRTLSADRTNATTTDTMGYIDVPRRTSGFARGQALAVSAGVTLNTSDMAAGYTFSVYNDSASAITITQGAGVTLRLAGSTTTGSRTLAARGMATIWCNSGSEAIISGAGVT